MAIDEGSIPVGTTGKLLRTFEQTTSEGLVHSEALSIVDPEDITQVAKVTNAAPAANDPGLVVRVVGSLVLGSEVEIKNDTGSPIPVSGTVSINGLPSFAHSQVTVTGTEAAIPAINLASRKTVSIKALAANGAAVYIGLTGVTAANGYELSAGDSVEIDADATVNLFAISASGSQQVSCMQVA